MVLIEDSRQKPDKNKHIKEQLEQLGHTVIRSKMLVGDYQIANKGDTVVDTKYGMNEVESNLIHDHERFRNECILSVYDDRGCDVVFATHEIMLPDFQKYIYIYTIFENPQIFFEIY